MYGSKTKNLLSRFEVGDTYKGFLFCVYSVNLAAEVPDRLNSVTKCIYPDVAKKYGTTTNCVERNIRTIAEVVWRKGGKEFFYNTSGVLLEKRPSNAKFLEILVKYIAFEETMEGPCQGCKFIADYKAQIAKLEEEIKGLNETIAWMHDLIWRLIKESKGIT